MNVPTDWLTALLILAAGLILGALLLFAGKRRKRAPQTSGGLELIDLQTRRDALIEQLRDSSTSAPEREALENEAAEVLRELDLLLSRGAAPTDALTSAAPQSLLVAGLKGFAWGVVICGVIWGLIFFVTGQAAPRAVAENTMPAGPTVADLQERVKREPSNLDLHIELALAHMQADNLMAAFEAAKVVLDQRPGDSRALTLQAVVRASMGEGEQAVEMLGRALQSDPKNLDAWVALAWVYAQSGKLQDAERAVASASREVPSEKAMLDQVLQQIRNRPVAVVTPR